MKAPTTPKPVANRGLQPFRDEDGVRSFTVPDGSPFRVLLLTDLHFGKGILSKSKDTLAQNAVVDIVERTAPDLILVLGDLVYPILPFSGTGNNLRESKFVSELMESFQIPWCFVFGNHDQEKSCRHKKAELADVYMQGKHCIFEKGSADIDGVGNYFIRLKATDGHDLAALLMLDSNMYYGKGFFSGFDHVHDNQIDWAVDQMNALSVKNGASVPTLAFMHIPIAEFREAWEKCYLGDTEVKYHCGFVGEKDNYFGFPKEWKTHIFEDFLKQGSVKGMFFGHDHLNTVSLTYKGIRLSYPLSIDALAYLGIHKKITQRGGSLLTINADGTFDMQHVPYQLSKKRSRFDSIA